MANEIESVTPAGRELVGTVLEAFTRYRLVGIGESHGLQNHHDALHLLLTDPRLPAALDDLVVEFGNARYQDTVDRFIAGGAGQPDGRWPRKLEAVTLDSKIVNSRRGVGEQQPLRSGHNRFAC